MIVPTSPEFALTAGSYTPPKCAWCWATWTQLSKITRKKPAASSAVRSTGCLHVNPELGAQWSSSETAQLVKLRELVKLAAQDETAEPSTYICEVQGSTLSPDLDDSAVTYNLQVT